MSPVEGAHQEKPEERQPHESACEDGQTEAPEQRVEGLHPRRWTSRSAHPAAADRDDSQAGADHQEHRAGNQEPLLHPAYPVGEPRHG